MQSAEVHTDDDEEEIFTRQMFAEEEESASDTDYDEGVSLSSYTKGALKQSVIEGIEIIHRQVCEIDSLWCTISEIDNHNKLLQRELNERKRKFAEIDRRPIEEDRHQWEMAIIKMKLQEAVQREKRKDAMIHKQLAVITGLKAEVAVIAELKAEVDELAARLSK